LGVSNGEILPQVITPKAFNIRSQGAVAAATALGTDHKTAGF
jgi:hypothetical protein